MRYRIKQVPHNLVFFLFGAAYIWLVIEPNLIYNCFGTILPDAPIFVTGWPFLENSLSLPGGFVLYISGFLSEGYYYSWLGTVIIVLSALFLSELSRRHLVAAGYTRATILASFPAILLFLIYSRFKHPLPACLTVSMGLLCSLVFERLPLRRSVVRAAVFCLMAAVVFWLTGAGGLLIFSLMTVIYGIFVHRDWLLPVLVVPASFAIIWSLAQYLFLIPPQQAFLVLTPFSPIVTTGMKTFSKVLVIILYSFVPLSVLSLSLGKKVFGKSGQIREKHSKPARRQKTQTATGQKNLFVTILKKSIVLAIPIGAMAVGLYFSHDQMSKPFVLTNDYYLRKQWDKILELAPSLPKGKSNVYFHHDVIRALYHTGRLPYDLFNFPQTPYGLLLTHEKKASYLTQFKLCDVFLELGQVNMAERMASEILAARNHSGIAVEKLAWINIIKNQNSTARIYLNALKKDLIFRGTAEALLRAMDNNFTPDQKAYIDRVRSVMHQKEYAETGKDSIEKMLVGLLAENPRNKMAFEYLMTCYLLTGQVDKIAANMEQLDGLGYEAIPVLYEEAVLIYYGSQGRKIDLNKFNIKPQTIQRYTMFLQLRNSMQAHNRQAVLNRLILEFGRSYFFYFTFRSVGLV